jgi:hypothetical protein
VTDLNPPDRLAEIQRLHRQHTSINYHPPGICVSCRLPWPCDASWLLGELVETRTLAADLAEDLDSGGRREPGWTLMDEIAATDRLWRERDVERARADQLQTDLGAQALRACADFDAYEAELLVLREHAARVAPLLDAARAHIDIHDRYFGGEQGVEGPEPTYDAMLEAARAALAGSVDTPPPADLPFAVRIGFDGSAEVAPVEPLTPEPTERCPWTPTGRHLERADRTCQFCVPVPPQEPQP